MNLQPSGTVFSSPVTVVLPFDFTKLPYGTDPNTQISVKIVEENGSSTVVFVDSVDSLNGTVTVQTNGFSVCIPIVQPGPPSFGYNSNGTVKAGGDEFWFLGLRDQFYGDVSGNDSRQRQVSIEEGTLSLYSDNTLQVSSQKTQLEWFNFDTGPGQVDGTVYTTTQANGDAVGWAYGTDGQTIVVTGGGSNYPIFAVSRDGMLLSSRNNDNTDAEGENIFAMRKPAEAPTLALLAGNYQGVGIQFKAENSGAGSPANVGLRRVFGTLTVTSAGGATLSFAQRNAQYDGSTGTWSYSLKNATVTGGTVVLDSVDVPGTFTVTFPDQNGETVEPMRIYPGRDWKGGFLTHRDPKSGDVRAFVFTREGSGMSNASLTGTYRGGLFDPDVQSYNVGTGPGVNVSDFDCRNEGVTATLTGGATGTLAFHDHKIQRNNSITGGVEVTEQNSSSPVSVTVTAKGKVTFGTSEGAGVGTVAPDGSFLTLTSDINNPNQDFFIGICIKSPPLIP